VSDVDEKFNKHAAIMQRLATMLCVSADASKHMDMLRSVYRLGYHDGGNATCETLREYFDKLKEVDNAGTQI